VSYPSLEVNATTGILAIFGGGAQRADGFREMPIHLFSTSTTGPRWRSSKQYMERKFDREFKHKIRNFTLRAMVFPLHVKYNEY